MKDKTDLLAARNVFHRGNEGQKTVACIVKRLSQGQ